MGDGALDHLADPVDALILLLRLLLVEFAIGGLLMGRDHPSSHIALVADPPGGVHSLQQSERRLVRPRVHGPRIGAPGAHTNSPSGRTRIRVVHPRAHHPHPTPSFPHHHTDPRPRAAVPGEKGSISLPGNAPRRPLNNLPSTPMSSRSRSFARSWRGSARSRPWPPPIRYRT